MPDDTNWFHSGGPNNKNPDRDLGGSPSQFKIATQPLNNLFNDIDPEQREIGLIDYRAFYIFNKYTNLHLMGPIVSLSGEGSGGSSIEFGVQQDDEIQRLQFLGINSSNPDNDGYLILQTEFGPPLKLNSMEILLTWLQTLKPHCKVYLFVAPVQYYGNLLANIWT